MQVHRSSFYIVLVLATAWSGPAAAQEVDARPQQLFQELDANRDGRITADEVSEEQKKHFNRLLKIGDEDGDQVLTRGEFLKGLRPDDAPIDQPGTVGSGPRDGDRRPQFDLRRLFDNYDRNQDGKLTREELPERAPPILRGLFQRSGKDALTREDLSRLDSRPPTGPPADADRTRARPDRAAQPSPQALQRAEEFFDRFDTNGDDRVTVAEAPERTKRLLEGILKRAGRDQDAALTRAEFISLLAGGRRPRAEEIGRGAGSSDRRDAGNRPGAGGPGAAGPLIFRKLDTNRDGQLSRSELARAAEIFTDLDSNQDGALDPHELFGQPPQGRGFSGSPTSRPGRPPSRFGSGRPNPGDQGRPRDRDRDRPRETDRRRPDAAADAADNSNENGEQIRRLFTRIDKDRDGKISRDEAPRQIESQFSAFDTNGDDHIDQAELTRAIARIRNAR